MADPVQLLTALVCAAICLRLVAFRRAGARYRFWNSLLAWVLAACAGCQALSSILGLYPVRSPFVLVTLLVLCVLVFRARGNVASIFRTDWSANWDGRDRRRVN